LLGEFGGIGEAGVVEFGAEEVAVFLEVLPGESRGCAAGGAFLGGGADHGTPVEVGALEPFQQEVEDAQDAVGSGFCCGSAIGEPLVASTSPSLEPKFL